MPGKLGQDGEGEADLTYDEQLKAMGLAKLYRAQVSVVGRTSRSWT